MSHTEPFLHLISRDMLTKHGADLSRFTMVFPGRRASLFMSEYLARISPTPVFAPRYVTVDELFASLSPYTRADQIETICLLYRIYLRHVAPQEGTDSMESLDEFWSWGEVLLSDFDDVDKHLADAKQLFRNIHDLEEVQTDYLMPEDEAVIRQFFSNFSREGNSALKQRFLRMWNAMYAIYTDLRSELSAQGKLTSGAFEREVVERLRSGKPLPTGEALSMPLYADLEAIDTTYVIVGFNVLNTVERELFRLLQKAGKAQFYWDYDTLWTDNTQYEAGQFMRQNLHDFPMDFAVEASFDNLRHLADINFVSSSTDNAQSRYIPQWLSAQLTPEREADTAIVLCDEHLLQPVLHSIPDTPGSPARPESLNVTMGFPLTDTPVFSFLMALVALQVDGWDAALSRFRPRFMATVRNHPYASFVEAALLERHVEGNEPLLLYLTDIVQQLAMHYAAILRPSVYDQLYAEALFRSNLQLTRFLQLIQSGTLQVGTPTLRRLLHQVLSALSIPFHGEPAEGLQVMGVLETRNLDFRHLLMLSVGEGNLPKKDETTSLIPYNLREAFGLTTIRHKVSVFAYYFYRLIQRAEHVTMVYNENSSGGVQHEMSRFMRQVMAETDLPVRHFRLEAAQNLPQGIALQAPKTEDVMRVLREAYIHEDGGRHRLSPSALSIYTSCPLRFYFKYVAQLTLPTDEEDGIEAATFGNIFHDTAMMVYMRIMHANQTKNITTSLIEPFTHADNLELRDCLDTMFHLDYFHPLSDEKQKDELIAHLAALPEADFFDAVSHLYKRERGAYFTGLVLIIRDVLLQYLVQLFAYDHAHAPFRMVALEGNCSFDIQVSVDGRQSTLTTGGRIDRLDIKGDTYRIIDYKTGRDKGNRLEKFDNIFEGGQLNGYFLQTFIYAHAIRQQYGRPAQPSLFFVRGASKPDEYDPQLFLGRGKSKIPVTDIGTYAQEFEQGLKAKVEELFDHTRDFVQCKDTDTCTYCDFNALCCRKGKND